MVEVIFMIYRMPSNNYGFRPMNKMCLDRRTFELGRFCPNSSDYRSRPTELNGTKSHLILYVFRLMKKKYHHFISKFIII